MKSRTIIILWTIAIILGISVYALKKSADNSIKTTTERSQGEKLIENFPADQITTISLTSADSAVTLSMKEGKWVVEERDNFPAETRNVLELLRTITDLKVTHNIEAGPSFAARFGVDESSSDPLQRGITASFKDASGNILTTLSFGKNLDSAASTSPLGSAAIGRYVRNHADPSGFYAVSELFPALTTEPQSWLAADFFNIEKIQSIALTQPGSDKTEWELIRDDENAEFKFTEAFPGVKIDPNSSTALKSLFSYARFDDVVPAAEVEKLANPEKLQTATIKTFEGLTYVIKLQPKKSDNPQPGNESYLLTVKASGEIPQERKRGENESLDIAQAADKAFAERRETLTKMLEQIQKIETRTFEVGNFTVGSLLKSRSELMDKGPGPQAQPANNGMPSFTPPMGLPR
jgi:hypothetical protein